MTAGMGRTEAVQWAAFPQVGSSSLSYPTALSLQYAHETLIMLRSVVAAAGGVNRIVSTPQRCRYPVDATYVTT